MVKAIKKFLYKIFCGLFLGLSVVAPGFSGSIIAIIMGIYQDILRIVSSPFKQLKQNIIFCIPLGIGAVVAAVLYFLTFGELLEAQEKATYFLFIGLIAGNIPIIFMDIKKEKFRKHYHIGGILAFFIAVGLSYIAFSFGETATKETAEALSGGGMITAGWTQLSLSGLAGGATALIPGMSVSMVLIITGVFDQLVLAAKDILHFNLTDLIPFGVFGLSAVVGLVITAKFLKAMFDRFLGFVNVTVMGFISGSLIGLTVFNILRADRSFTWPLGIMMLAIGLAVSMLFVVLGKKMDKE